jgi:hypothetical protein
VQWHLLSKHEALSSNPIATKKKKKKKKKKKERKKKRLSKYLQQEGL